MPTFNPTTSQIYVNRPLTTFSHAYSQAATNFAALQTFGVLPVDKQSDMFYKVPKGAWLRAGQVQRIAPGGEHPTAGWELDPNNTYYCDVFGLGHTIADEDVANQDDAIDLESDAVEWLTQQMLMHYESVFNATYYGASKWSVDKTGVTAAENGTTTFRSWKDYANSDPITDVRRFIREGQGATGIRFNQMNQTRDVADILMDHPDIIARINAGQTPGGPALASLETLARIFAVDRIIVSDAVSNSAAEGLADNVGFMQTNAAFLSYRNPRVGRRTPTAGLTFGWRGLNGIFGDAASVIETFSLRPLKKATQVQISASFAMKIIANDLGMGIVTPVA